MHETDKATEYLTVIGDNNQNKELLVVLYI